MMPVELIHDLQNPIEAEERPTPPPTDLPYDDGEPLESNRHRIAMNVLIDSLNQAYQGREDYFTGGNMFIYYSSRQARNVDFRGPDFFAVLNVDGTRERRTWTLWEEEGRYPDTIVEFMSPSTASIDTDAKKTLYEQTFRTQDYYVYDPFDRESLQGWHLGNTLRYEELEPDDRGFLWCESLGLWLGTWQGILKRENATWLRFYDRSGNLVLLPEEIAENERQRADLAEQNLEEERERNQQLRDRLLQLGVDPDSIA